MDETMPIPVMTMRRMGPPSLCCGSGLGQRGDGQGGWAQRSVVALVSNGSATNPARMSAAISPTRFDAALLRTLFDRILRDQPGWSG